MPSPLPQKTPYLPRSRAQFWNSHIRKANPWELLKLTCFQKVSHKRAPTAYSHTPLESGSQRCSPWAPITGLWTSPVGSLTSVFRCCWSGPAVVAMPSDHHPCSQSSASGCCGCRDTVPSMPIFRTSCHSYQHLFHSPRSAASPCNRTPRIAPGTQRSLFLCQRTRDTAKVDSTLANSRQKSETGRK